MIDTFPVMAKYLQLDQRFAVEDNFYATVFKVSEIYIIRDKITIVTFESLSIVTHIDRIMYVVKDSL